MVTIITIIVVILLNRGNKYNIELVGDDRIIVTIGSTYIEPGYSAYDRKNNIIHLLKKPSKHEILHEIGHAIETKYDIYNISAHS